MLSFDEENAEDISKIYAALSNKKNEMESSSNNLSSEGEEEDDEDIMDLDLDLPAKRKKPFSSNQILSSEPEENESEIEDEENNNNNFVPATEDFKNRLKLMNFDSEEDYEERIVVEEPVKATPVKKMKKPKEDLKSVLRESESLLRRVDPIVELKVQVLKPKSLDLVLSEALAASSTRKSKTAAKRVVEEKQKQQRAKLEKFLGKEKLEELCKEAPKIGQNKLDEAVEIEIDDEKGSADGAAGGDYVKFKLVDLPDKHFDERSGRSHTKPFSSSSSATLESPNNVASYRVYLQSHKKASIEQLNRELEIKIRAQSNAALSHHQRQLADHNAAKRAKMEAREKARRQRESQKESELKMVREKKACGGNLFAKSKVKYAAVERPEKRDDDDGQDYLEEEHENVVINNNCDGIEEELMMSKVKAKKIRILDDEEEENLLLNLSSVSENDVDDVDGGEGFDELPEMKAAIKDKVKKGGIEFESLTGLLSGKFESETEGEEDAGDGTELESEAENQESEQTNNKNISNNKNNNKSNNNNNNNNNNNSNNNNANANSVNRLQRSAFIDDEASDEDEERVDGDEIDEEAIRLEMEASKFIADSASEDEDGMDLRAFANERSKKEDAEMEKRLMARFGNHLEEESGSMIASLENKYGLSAGGSEGKSGNFVKSTQDLDEDVRLLLDPLEQKKRKLAALGSLNILQRPRLVEAATEEFRFPDKALESAASSSDYYASESESEYENQNGDEDEIVEVDGEGEREDYYEAVESGLQSRVAEMLDEEMLDAEEVQVQACESLSAHLDSLPNKSELIKTTTTPTTTKTKFDNANNNNVVKKSVVVPKVDAKLKSRLAALQQENDENVQSGPAVFRGFTIKK